VGYENNDKKMDSVYSKRIKAGKRRTYFFDVRATRGNDFYLTITESRKRFNDDGYDRHKIFLYKEDFNKFVKGLSETVDYVKTELMPDYDFDAFNHEYDSDLEAEPTTEVEVELSAEVVEIHPNGNGIATSAIIVDMVTAKEIMEENNSEPSTNHHEEVDKW
jgi:flagellar basal body L-ring protein FlgH